MRVIIDLYVIIHIFFIVMCFLQAVLGNLVQNQQRANKAFVALHPHAHVRPSAVTNNPLVEETSSNLLGSM